MLLVTWNLSTGPSGRWTFSLWNFHKRLSLSLSLTFYDFTLSVHLLYCIPFLVLLPPNIPRWTYIVPDVYRVCLLGLAKTGGSEGLLAQFLKLGEDLKSTLFINMGPISSRAAGVNNELARSCGFAVLMALLRVENHVTLHRPFSLDWILFFFNQMYTLQARIMIFWVLTNP